MQGDKAALLANYITCDILTRLGYFVNLDKSVFQPTQTPVHLGFIVDSVEHCFRVTKSKKEKFVRLRDELLKNEIVNCSKSAKICWEGSFSYDSNSGSKIIY